MPAPLAHVSGLLHGVLVPGVAGMRTVLMPNWNPADALELIETEAITYMVGPPTFFLALMDDPAFPSTTHEVPSDVVLRRGGCDAGLRGTSPERTRRSRQTILRLN
ncbi:MAG: hypothetical protein Ct9H300mP12_03960 [Acidimicrobiales bacterium]|nr:MAG: hypothetical protein Ct9H300mP12_03960 [Acidimicrobiales bacterium]